MFLLSATSAKKFRHLICAAPQAESVQLQCCRVSPGTSSTASYIVEGWKEAGGGKLIVRDYMQPELSDLLTNSIILTLMVLILLARLSYTHAYILFLPHHLQAFGYILLDVMPM